MNNEPNPPEDNGRPRRMGSLAARKREQLDKFDAARRQLMEKQREERETLVRELAEADAKKRRRDKTQEVQKFKRAKFLLGGMLLAAVRESGHRPFIVTVDDLKRLTQKDRDIVEPVLLAMRASNDAADDKPSTTPDADGAAAEGTP